MLHPMFEKHQALLLQAVAAAESRAAFSPFAEHPAAYGENAVEQGRAAFEAYRDASFYLDQPGVIGRGGAENSPYGLPLNVSYPSCNPDALILAARGAMPVWVKAGADTRAGVCLEMLVRLNQGSMELAHAVMHTTGQPFPMAFQVSTVQAQERGLEAVALACRAMRQVPQGVIWEKPQGKNPPLRIEKRYAAPPRGIALVIASSVAPTLYGYPALFASLATGNPVIVKAHPEVILPLAITVAVMRQTLKDAGFDANLVSLLIDDTTAPVGKLLALNHDIRIIDYCGNSEFGDWLEENARQAAVFTQKPGIHCVVVDSTDDYKGLLRNLTLSLCLYSGQTCTAPRRVFVSQEGVQTPEGTVSGEQFSRDLSFAVGKLLEDPARAVEVLGAIRSPTTLAQIDTARELGEVMRDSFPLAHPLWPQARVHTPLLLKLASTDEPIYMEEHFGPILLIVETATRTASLSAAERVMEERGALLFSVYSTHPRMQELAEETSQRWGVTLSLNLTGNDLLSQEASFSDFHGSGANPSGNTTQIDEAYVARRFHIVGSRRPAHETA